MRYSRLTVRGGDIPQCPRFTRKSPLTDHSNPVGGQTCLRSKTVKGWLWGWLRRVRVRTEGKARDWGGQSGIVVGQTRRRTLQFCGTVRCANFPPPSSLCLHGQFLVDILRRLFFGSFQRVGRSSYFQSLKSESSYLLTMTFSQRKQERRMPIKKRKSER